MAGLAPGVVLAGILHIGVFLLAYGAPPLTTPPEAAPPTLTLVSLPPEPPSEPGTPADPAQAEDAPPAPPQPVAAAQDAEKLPEPIPPAPSALPEPSIARNQAPPAQDTAPQAAIAEMLPALALPTPSPPGKAEALPQPTTVQVVPKPAAKATPPRTVPAKPVRQASHSVRVDPWIDASHLGEASKSEAAQTVNAPAPTPMPAPHAAPAAVEASFAGRLLQAVQAEARRSYPPAARLMGTTGQAVVAFEYRDGMVHVTGLAQTSGSPMLDRAALAAVQNASYPPSPSELAGQTLARVVHVKFELTPG